jgi:sugar phosphate isomerase/epimerase
MTRKDFLQTVAGGALLAAAQPGFGLSDRQAQGKMKRGVSLYSYQEEYYARTMTLEDCIAEASVVGAKGIEILPTGCIPEYPNISDRWVANWHSLMAKYNTTPSCYDIFLEMDLHRDRRLSDNEAVDMLIRDIKLAKRLGYKVLRGVNHTPLDVLEKGLPYAEQNDIRLTTEIHSPIPLDGEYVNQCMDMIQRTKTKHFGLTIDLSLFLRRPIRVMAQRAIRDGIPAPIVQCIQDAFRQGVPKDKAQAEAEKMGYKDEDDGYGTYLMKVYDTPMQDLKKLKALMPHVFHVHAKCWEMTEEMVEYSIPYDEIVPVLAEGGYDGYLSTEYEGQRFTQDIAETDSCEQIRRNQFMLKKLLHEV